MLLGIEPGMVRGATPYVLRKAHENPKVFVRARRGDVRFPPGAHNDN